MAPMTRGRADAVTGVPHPLAPVYYARRASAGLIVTEGVWPTPIGRGEEGVPGIVTEPQIAAWRKVTTAVHAAGGRIFAQLWHVGRLSHPDVMPGGVLPVAPSAVRAPGMTHVPTGKAEFVTPRQLTVSEIQSTVEEFAVAARNAIDSGFDGVELHGANGYLIHQFIADNTNLRTDGYGGSLAGRLRFPLEVVHSVADAVGADRVGLRVSPGNPENDLVEVDPATTYRTLLEALGGLDLAYLHIVDSHANGESPYPALADLRPHWDGTLIGNVGAGEPTTQEEGERLLADRLVDVVAFGRLFLGNPDLPVRFATGAPLSHIASEHHYGYGLDGYVEESAA